jgi:hypothetical protein
MDRDRVEDLLDKWDRRLMYAGWVVAGAASIAFLLAIVAYLLR